MAPSAVYALLGLLCLGAHQTSGQAFYCRDPDTGKLHDVNSTWPATTFCGNYTCKLRRKGPAENVPPVRQFKVANVNISDIITNIPKTTSEIVYDNLKTKNQKNMEYRNMEMNNVEPAIRNRKQDDVGMTTENDDRYLNENEISNIARLLHTIKKSDLAAIVDIYNLAKDIRSLEETDNESSKNVVEEKVNTIKSHNEKSIKVKQNSYWYDPVYTQHKTKKDVDMVYQGSDHIPTTHEIHETDPVSYFKGALSNKDFGKLPYYYPMSSFQHEYSYSYPKPVPRTTSHDAPQNSQYFLSQYTLNTAPQFSPHPLPQKPPCTVKSCNQDYLSHPYKYPIIQGISQGPNRVLMKPFTLEHVNNQQPILLPYPYSYIQHYNSTAPGYYYDRNLWSLIDMYNKYNIHYKPYYIAEARDQTPRSKPESVEDTYVENIEKAEKIIKSLLSKTKEHITKVSSWHTPPISNDVLEDIRAHFEEKSLLKPFPLRKKVKVEKVGKVINLDELNKRSKRSAVDEKETEMDSMNQDNFEAYIERTTCDMDKAPGYFRIGNLTELYPACCPQRINKLP